MVYMCTPLELNVLKMLTKFGHDSVCVYCCLEELSGNCQTGDVYTGYSVCVCVCVCVCGNSGWNSCRVGNVGCV